MAKYLISKPAYVNGVHLGAQATLRDRIEIEIPDSTVPSLTWEPADKAALDAYALAVEARIEGLTFGLEPAKAKVIADAARKQYEKKMVAALPEPKKPATREANTMAEMAEAKSKVVGRASDRSPV